MVRSLIFCLAFWLPAAAFAASVGGEVAVGSVDMPAADGSSGEKATYAALGLSGSIDLVEDALLLDLDLISLKDGGSALSYQGAVGLAWFVNDHWNLDLLATFSPKRRSTYDTAVPKELLIRRGVPRYQLSGTGLLTDASIHSTDSTGGLAVAAGYDTFGDSNLETAVDALVSATRYRMAQRVVVPLNSGRSFSSKTFEDQLTQFRLGVTVTETLFQDTDLQLHFSYYLYSKPPEEYGAVVWVPALGGAVPTGTGSPIAPLKWELRPMVAHRFGRSFSAAIQLGVGRYQDGGSTGMAGLKLKLKPTSSLRLSLNALVQRDAGLPDTPVLLSRYLGLGATWYFR